jgi:hypothetical protein
MTRVAAESYYFDQYQYADREKGQVLTPWRVMPNGHEKGMQRSIVTFERSQ